MAEEIIDTPFAEGEDPDGEEIWRTYKMDLDKKRIGGFVDNEEAVVQAIWKTLSTTRFAHLIYDDQYGCDFFNKINDSDLTMEYLEADMPKMLEEALTVDSRITGVNNFSYEQISGDSVHIQFTAETIYGDIALEGVIKDGD